MLRVGPYLKGACEARQVSPGERSWMGGGRPRTCASEAVYLPLA